MHFAKLFALGLAAAAFGSATASAAQLDCSGLPLARVVQGKNATTSSKEFVEIAGSEVMFPNNMDCITIEFSGKLSAPAPQVMRVRVLFNPPELVANEAIIPATMDFTTAAAASDGRATLFFVRNAIHDARTLRMQFMSVKGGPVTLDSWTAIVRFSGGG